eukprot:TRINITY_DN8529_c0_g1_i1.p1 TRINITY_DN8529_c0_g1~~TRINITY_DN8529_c0_g1_i1.p1  ORF type:complete len:1024 (-),score=212.75 TRINITY_DN8529_c0_g1_i1:298-3369(-)
MSAVSGPWGAEDVPERLPILPLKNCVLLPGAIIRVRCTSPTSVRLVEQELWQKPRTTLVGVVPAWDVAPSPVASGAATAVATRSHGAMESNSSMGSTTSLNGEKPAGNVALGAGRGEKEQSSGQGRARSALLGGVADFQQSLGKLLSDPLHWHTRGVTAHALHVSRRVEKRTGRVAYAIVLEGLSRVEVEAVNARGPYHTARVILVDEGSAGRDDDERRAHAAMAFQNCARHFFRMLDTKGKGGVRSQGASNGSSSSSSSSSNSAANSAATRQALLDSTPAERVADRLVAALPGVAFAARLTLLDAQDSAERLEIATGILRQHMTSMDDALLHKEEIGLVINGNGHRLGSSGGPGRHQQGLQEMDNVLVEPTTVALTGKMIQGGQMKNLKSLADAPLVRSGNNDMGGDDDDDDDEAALEKKVEGAGMPPNVWKHAKREVRRLRKMQTQSPGYSSARQYVELLADLPWKASSGMEAAEIALPHAKERLDAEHFGLASVKRRIIEYIAVYKLKPDARGPILCFVGPPGVGKTSLASSIASALGRRFVRIALGGVKDEADVRGHRRTYVGSMPGRLIEGMKRVGVSNPVMLLDEIDKVGTDARGDPAAALLEVLDPEQNGAFMDHYLGVPFDLSRVVFLATANRAAPIPAPLLDRMEVIELPGYTPEEKQRIAVRHLVPRVLEQNGITKRHLHVQEHVVEMLIQRYTREAGVRTLSRHLAALARAAAVKVAESRHSLRLTREIALGNADGGEGGIEEPDAFTSEGVDMEMGIEALGFAGQEVAEAMLEAQPLTVDETVLESVLGPPKFDGNEAAERVAMPGVAVGLVWTAVGGEVQFVEASSMFGRGELHLTGQLGEVIKESAQIALTWVRSRAADLQLIKGKGSKDDKEEGTLDESFSHLMDSRDLHIHFPAGAVPKDGPSAGVTLVTALVSLLTHRSVRSDTAMTGELTLRGLVLPVGGVKEKILAAHRCGIRRVILPHKNLKDLQEVPSAILACMEILPTKRVEDVLKEAFDGGCPVKPRARI